MKPLKTIWNSWKSIAEKISIAVNTALLAAIYIAVIAPTALIRKLLAKKKKETTYWKDFEQEDGNEALKRQF
ncbi:hypothetical protein HYU15_00515 [Candidatus Woesearchaeota archaeon]|nr:hypothetical protein [Candidatus Woesearchaeota archaeon]